MLYSEILISIIFNKNQGLSSWIGEQQYIKMLVWQFSNIITYIRNVGKLQDQHFSVSLFSNPGGNILILVESRGQICPVVFHFFLDLSSWIGEQQYTKVLLWQFSSIPVIYDYVGKMLEQHFNVLLFSNPGGKILIIVEIY